MSNFPVDAILRGHSLPVGGRRGSRLVVVIFAGMLATAGAQDGATNLAALEEQAFKQAAALVSPSVVRIQTVGGLDRVGNVLTVTGPTTGVAVSRDGYIISSTFNFIARPASILVELPDGRRFPAQQVANDRSKMLTLLKIDADDLVPVEAAPKQSIRVGQWTLALGRTFDAQVPSVSVGIVSALGRIWGKAIQTDAKVSPVNYGGPLVDVEGRVLGVLVPMSPRGNEETAGVEWYDSGIGFAVPMEDVYAALDRLKTGADLHPGLMGVMFKDMGVLAGEPKIDRVRADSPAENAGFEAGDVIVEIDGEPVSRLAEVRHALGARYAGDTVTVAVRRGEETIKKELTLVEKLVAWEAGFLGILPERPAAAAEPVAGVTVRHVFEGSPAAAAGLADRDHILKFGGQDVADAADLLDRVSRLRPGEKAPLVYTRDGAEKTVEVTLASVPNDVPGELRFAPIPAPPEAEAEERPKTGKLTIELPEYQRSHWAYVPDLYNSDYKYGLVVWIHPETDTMEGDIVDAWKSICEERGLLLVGPRAGDIVAGWTPNEAEYVKDVVDDLRKKYSIDPARIVLHGFGDGGQFAWQLAFKYREVFAGVAAAGAAMASEPDENRPDHRQQFHVVTGETDPDRRAIQQTVSTLRGLKFPVSLSVITDWDHKYPPYEQVLEMARWVDILDRI